MNSRRSARRRKGSHRMQKPLPPPRTPRMVAASKRASSEAAELRAITRTEQASSQARRLITRFDAKIVDPVYVYFVRQTGVLGCGSWLPEGPVKIGTARNPYARLRELQCGNPSELYIEEAILGSARLEHDLRRHFADARLYRGEWFDRGYADAIVALAGVTRKLQIKASRAGSTVDYISSVLPRDIFMGADRLRDVA